MSTFFTTDHEGWLLGESPVEVPGSVSIEPPPHDAQPTPGEPWPRWWRIGWTLDLYPQPPGAPVAYGFDAEGWYSGLVPVGTPGSTRVRPDILSTEATPGAPRSRWRFGSWEVQTFAHPPRHITRRSFTNRFSTLEEAAIDLASIDPAAGTQEQRIQAAVLRAQRRKVSESPYVDLDLAQTRAGVLALEGAGLLAPGRALEILDAPIQPDERYAP